MSYEQSLRSLSDDELLRRLADLLCQSRRGEADLVAHIAEVDERRLYAREAAPSMHAYCTEVLHLSEPEAFLRITVARASRRHPVLLAMLADGRLHLSGIALLAPHLTADNRDAILARATHKSKRQVEELVAELSPRPDACDRIRKVPERRPLGATPAAETAAESGPGGSLQLNGAEARGQPSSAPGSAIELRPDGVTSIGGDTSRETPADSMTMNAFGSGQSAAGVATSTPSRASAAVVLPLSPGRYQVQFTASAELREKLERLRALMRSSHHDVSLAAVIDTAVSQTLQRLEARRLARAKRPRSTVNESETRPTSRHIPAAVRRAVRERDEGQCRYVDREGRRCTARHGLEYHHRHPFGVGGDHTVENIRLLCRTHNRYIGEIDYGRRIRRRATPERPRSSADSP